DLLDARRIGRAPGRYLGIVFERIVNEATFVGIHWLELKRATGNAHTFGQFPNALHDAIFAHGTVMFAIDDNLFGILVSGLQQPVKQKLDSLQRLAVAANQATTFLGINLQRRVAALVTSLLDLHYETEITEQSIEQIFRRHHRFRFAVGATFSS